MRAYGVSLSLGGRTECAPTAFVVKILKVRSRLAMNLATILQKISTIFVGEHSVLPLFNKN